MRRWSSVGATLLLVILATLPGDWARGAQMLGQPRTLFHDDNGDPIGGCMFTFECGTTTPKTVYADPSLSTAHSNPVQATSRGEFPAIYFAGCLKMALAEPELPTGECPTYENADIEWVQDNYYGMWERSEMQIAMLSDYASFHAALEALSGQKTELWIDTDGALSQNETVSDDIVLKFMPGRKIVTGSYTLTLEQQPDAGNWQIVDTSGGGSVVWPNGPNVYNPAWVGDSPEFQVRDGSDQRIRVSSSRVSVFGPDDTTEIRADNASGSDLSLYVAGTKVLDATTSLLALGIGSEQSIQVSSSGQAAIKKAKIGMGSPTTLTISSGSITPTDMYHFVDTEGGASVDVLSSISGGSVGDLLVLRPYSDSRKIIVFMGYVDGPYYTLSGNRDVITFVNTGSNWQIVSYTDGDRGWYLEIPSTEDPNPAAYTISDGNHPVESDLLRVKCLDPDGCELIIYGNYTWPGETLTIVNWSSTYTVTISGTGYVDLQGTSDCVLGEHDSLTLRCPYATMWVEVARSNN